MDFLIIVAFRKQASRYKQLTKREFLRSKMATNLTWIDKLKSAKKAGLLQNGIILSFSFSTKLYRTF
jgi:hypothetical protein